MCILQCWKYVIYFFKAGDYLESQKCCVWMFTLHACVYVSYVCSGQRAWKRASDPMKLELQRGELPCGLWESNLSLLQEQQVLLTTGQSLQARSCSSRETLMNNQGCQVHPTGKCEHCVPAQASSIWVLYFYQFAKRPLGKLSLCLEKTHSKISK